MSSIYMLDIFYKCAIVIKISIDLIHLTTTIITKYKEFKNYKSYINEHLQYGFNSDLHYERPFI